MRGKNMSTGAREVAVQTLLAEIRDLSADFDNLSQTVAAHVGISATDLLAMDLISRRDRVTAGQIGDRLRMSSGAITGVIDRLERAGLAQRTPDSHDRRKVLVIPTAKGDQVGALFDRLVASLEEVSARYSDENLALLSRFIQQVRIAVHETAQGIKSN
jgi:DNA-binding MarR family transcriptional regulator